MKRILQIVGNLDRGGAETWLMQVLRGLDREQFHFDFVVHEDRAWNYRAEAEALGSKVLLCEGYRNPIKYVRSLAKLLRKHGPYDCIHSHIHHYSGVPLLTGRLLQVPTRVIHSHLDSSWVDDEASPARKAYVFLMKRLIWSSSTTGAAVSTCAGDSLFPPAWQEKAKWFLQPCGIDLEPFHDPVDRQQVRRELDIPADARVVGHVGRFHEQKNHSFLLDVAAATVRSTPNVVFLLVGEGPLKSTIRAKAEMLGLGQHVRFLGVRSDVARLMRGAMDVFLFPSHYEGLALVLLEAQASGLPCLISDRIAPEADVIRALVVRESLSSSAERWAERLAALVHDPPVADRPLPDAWSVERSIEMLMRTYSGQPPHAAAQRVHVQ